MRTNLKKSIIPQSPIPLHQEQAEKVTSYLSSPARREQEIYENTLKRDGRRCIITRYLLASDFRNTGAEVPPGEGTVAKLEVAHIIPFLYGSYKNQEVCIYLYFCIILLISYSLRTGTQCSVGTACITASQDLTKRFIRTI